MPELANGPGPNPGAVKRMQDRDLLHPPDAVRRDDGIGKRTRLESEGGKTHARSERALSAKLYIDNALNFVADGELKPVRLMFQRQPYIRMGSKSPKPTNV